MAYFPQMPLGFDPATVGMGGMDPETAWLQACSIGLEQGVDTRRDISYEQQPEYAPLPVDHTAVEVDARARETIPEWPTRDRYLLLNPLSQLWTWQAVAEDPKRITTLAGCYALGIVGYALALPFRIVVFVKELFHLPIAFFHNLCVEHGHNFGKTMQVRILCLFGATGELVSGVVGLVCPPVAYQIDEKIQDNNVIHANSRFRGARVEPGSDFGTVLAATIGQGSQERIAIKAELLRPIRPQLRQAVEKMAEYIDPDELAGVAPLTLNQVALIGLLLAYKDNLQAGEASFLDPLAAHLERYYPDINYGEHTEVYVARWAELSESQDDGALIDRLVLKAIQGTIGEDFLSIGEGDFLERKLADLQAQLPEDDEAFDALYHALSAITDAILQTDNELLMLVGTESNLRPPEPIEGILPRLNNWWIHAGSDE